MGASTGGVAAPQAADANDATMAPKAARRIAFAGAVRLAVS
jgi:hypothetical protein